MPFAAPSRLVRRSLSLNDAYPITLEESTSPCCGNPPTPLTARVPRWPRAEAVLPHLAVEAPTAGEGNGRLKDVFRVAFEDKEFPQPKLGVVVLTLEPGCDVARPERHVLPRLSAQRLIGSPQAREVRREQMCRDLRRYPE